MTVQEPKGPVQDADNDPLDILLVEDNEADVKITLRAFEKSRFKNNIFVAKNGSEALDFVRHQGKYADAEKFPRPDFIFMDIRMPLMDGLQALEKIKSDPALKDIPVAMLTTSAHETDILKSYELGAISYIPKPDTYDELIRVVDGFNTYWKTVSRIPGKIEPKPF